MTGTSTGTFDLFGLPPTGRPVTMTGQEIFRAEGGKLVFGIIKQIRFKNCL